MYQWCNLVCTQACTLRDCALLLPSGCLSVSLSLCRSVSLLVALLFICLSSSHVSPLLLSLFLCGLVPTVLLCDDGPQFYILRAESLSAVLRDMGLAPTPQSLILHLSTTTAMLCENGRVDEISKVYVMCVCVCVCVCVCNNSGAVRKRASERDHQCHQGLLRSHACPPQGNRGAE